MKSICKKLLILLIVYAMPTVAIAAENAAGDQKTAPTVQPAPPAVTDTAPKTPEPPRPQPATQAAPAVAAPVVTPPPSILIGYVDLGRISSESETGKAGQSKLTEKKKKLQTQIETKRKQLDKQRAAIEAKLATFTPEQRESKAREFQKKVDEYQKFVQKADNELQELQQELSRTLFEMIERAASEYGKRYNLALVTVKRDLLYLADNVLPQDVTDGVVQLINEQGQKK